MSFHAKGPTKTKDEANYKPATSGKHCGNCSMYRAHTCTLVKGPIDPHYVCKFWDARN